MTAHEQIAKILNDCEENNTCPKYIIDIDTYREMKSSLFQQQLPKKTVPVDYKSSGEEIFVVSDLHIASGRNKSGVYNGTENFFADDSFFRFLNYADECKKSERAILIINGDIFDFLRITEFPGKIKKVRLVKKFKMFIKGERSAGTQFINEMSVNAEFKRWSIELEKIGIKKSADELEKSISKKEKTYGLKTDDFKTVYKLIKIREGHPSFFKALGRWLEKENKLILLKGNHDLELYWKAVRDYIRLILAEEITEPDHDITSALIQKVLPNLTFIDDAIEIDKDFYVEHGHRYDKYTMVLDGPVLEKNNSQLNIPFGSFFNRYLLNRIELFFPFLDNVRPAGNLLPVLIKENFPLSLKVFFQHIPLFLRILTTNFRYVKFMLNRVFWFLCAIAGPVLFLIIFYPSLFADLIKKITEINSMTGLISVIVTQAKNLGLLILPYFLARLVAWLQLSEPSSLNTYAEMISEKTKYRIITMGHTHNPGQYHFGEHCSFYNTGTWIPIIENSTADVREDMTYTFLHLIRDDEGRLITSDNGLLMRWNDDAARAEPQILVQRK